MRLLVLGGNVFLGRAIARHARDAGHDVTCATRGRSGATPGGVRFVTVDRDRPDGLTTLAGERFDAVVDVARLPSHVRGALSALADRIGHWVFVSTGSVYADTRTPGQRVDADPPLLPPAPDGEDLDEEAGGPEAYGRNKVACERAVAEALGPGRSLICRAGLLVGPEDPTGRFEYWVRRVARAGEVLVPGDPADAVQILDVRDLAAWLVSSAESRHTGTYDGVGAPMPRSEFLAALAEGVRTRPTFTWVDQDFLTAAEVRPWMGPRSLPLWLPLPEYAGFLTRDADPIRRAGLRTRPLAHTAHDTLEWLAGRPDAVGKCGLTGSDEADLLRRWRDPAR
jgi:nucleoside-diphosphate-sugar epimerase